MYKNNINPTFEDVFSFWLKNHRIFGLDNDPNTVSIIEDGYSKNYDVLPEGPLIHIPELKTYRVNVKASVTRYEIDYYQLDVNACSPEQVKEMEESGVISYYDGEIIDTDTIDAETNEYHITSITEI